MDFIIKHIDVTTDIVKNRIARLTSKIENIKYAECDYLSPPILPKDLTFIDFDEDGSISGRDKHFWLKFQVDVPHNKKAGEARVDISTGHREGWDVLNPQMLVFIDGNATQGLDVNHKEIYLDCGKHEVLIYAYNGMISTEFKVKLFYKEIDLPTLRLYYDLVTINSALETLGENAQQYSQLCAKAKKALKLIDINSVECDFYESVKSAAEYFDDYVWGAEGINELATVSFIGHTHIDVAWLWTVAQTKEKVQRSCATVCKLMELYPDYRFFLSQPILYEFVKNNLPEVYSTIQERVKQGRWEAEGGMWVEADCNLSGGESLIRQFLYGKRFFKEEFGVDSKILWLPDAFGFSAALPQILKKCNIDAFITSKLSWGEENKYPYDLFMWRGIDGSEVLTNFITARDVAMPWEDDTKTRYNGYTTPSYVLGAWQRFQQKQYSNEILVPFGYSDGGGSANEQMLEILERNKKGIAGFPKSRSTGIVEYIDRIKSNFKKACEELGEVPKWCGELYLELHRGTYTTMSEIKKYNRFCEFLYQKAEQISVLSKMIFNTEYPCTELEAGWKNILLNQFHDILPGSSIKEVYDDAFKLYEETYEQGKEICNTFMKTLSASTKATSGILVYNANSFEVSDYVECNGKLIYARNIPSMGWKVIHPEEEVLTVAANKTLLENGFYKITFDESGNIRSIYDKKACRDIVEANKVFNAIEIFENYPYCYDAWEISEYYKDKLKRLLTATSVQVEKTNTYAQIKVERKFSKSSLVQTTRLYNHSNRIDFWLDIEWNEEKTLIKAAFPMNIHTDEAMFDIQFGSIVRSTHNNTSWDKSKFEVCGHKWVDLSEDNYGVSLINDSKYGFSCEESTLKMTILTSPRYPNPEADLGKHTISYAVIPHAEPARSGLVVQEAYKFNQPLVAASVSEAKGNIDNTFSLLQIVSKTVIAETVKLAEDGQGIVVRMYQSANVTEKICIKLGINAQKCAVCDMLENTLRELKVVDNTITLEIKPFEIVTLKIRRVI